MVIGHLLDQAALRQPFQKWRGVVWVHHGCQMFQLRRRAVERSQRSDNFQLRDNQTV